MHAVLYRSRSRAGLLAGDLNDIIATAGRRNARLGVTGLLLYGELEAVPGAPGEFVQWIEGPEAAVEGLFDAVDGDPRHTEVEVLGRGPVARLAARRPGRARPPVPRVEHGPGAAGGVAGHAHRVRRVRCPVRRAGETAGSPLRIRPQRPRVAAGADRRRLCPARTFS